MGEIMTDHIQNIMRLFSLDPSGHYGLSEKRIRRKEDELGMRLPAPLREYYRRLGRLRDVNIDGALYDLDELYIKDEGLIYGSYTSSIGLDECGTLSQDIFEKLADTALGGGLKYCFTAKSRQRQPTVRDTFLGRQIKQKHPPLSFWQSVRHKIIPE
jgi:hypothetical protein